MKRNLHTTLVGIRLLVYRGKYSQEENTGLLENFRDEGISECNLYPKVVHLKPLVYVSLMPLMNKEL